ncbi:GlsB/YeaQ/YmgE family stress response membrane protein [Geodermatophilus sp. SYSU D00079]
MIWDILGLIVVGLIIGALARLLKPGKQQMSILATMVLGVIGALIGGFIASLIGTGDIFELNILGFILAVVAAVILVGVYAGMSGGRNRAVR